MSQTLSRVCCGVLSALLLSAPVVQAAPSKAKRAHSSKTSRTPPPAPAPQLAPATVEAVPAEVRPVLESKAKRPAVAPARQEKAAEAPGGLRIGLGADVFADGGQMTGEQRINTSRRDESFDFSNASFLSATAWVTTPVPTVSERLRVGAGLRILGNYGAGGRGDFGFGLLNEAFLSGEYGLPVAEKMEVLFGGRAGLAVLVPGRELEAEIRRLQQQGVDVWSVPRVGWLVGPSVGARRRMSERIWLRADVLAQAEQLYLFATSQEIAGLQYSKAWSTLGLRLGLTLGAEFSL